MGASVIMFPSFEAVKIFEEPSLNSVRLYSSSIRPILEANGKRFGKKNFRREHKESIRSILKVY